MTRRSLPFLAFLCALSLPACAQGGLGDDAGPTGMDSGPRRDAGRDASRPLPDTGIPRMDAGEAMDAGGADAGRLDGGRADDAGAPREGGARDGGARDGGALGDAGPPDAGSSDCRPSADTLVITEVMVASRSGGGDEGEWFEVRNLGSCPVNLTGLVIEGTDLGGSPVMHEVTEGLVTARGFFVFAQSRDTSANHGLPYDYAYGSGSSGVVLNNAGDMLTLRFDSVVVDSVSYGSVDFTYGASRQLSREAEMEANGSLGSPVWCNATDIYSSADLGPYRGTPGALNKACP